MKRLIGANIGIVIATVITLGAPAAKAEPLSGGFSVKHQALIEAAPHDVYRALSTSVGDWWNPQHTFTGVVGGYMEGGLENVGGPVVDAGQP